MHQSDNQSHMMSQYTFFFFLKFHKPKFTSVHVCLQRNPKFLTNQGGFYFSQSNPSASNTSLVFIHYFASAGKDYLLCLIPVRAIMYSISVISVCNKCRGSHPGCDCHSTQQSEQRERARNKYETGINSFNSKTIYYFSLGQGCFLVKTDTESFFASSLFNPQITSSLEYIGGVTSTTIRFSPSG